MSNPYFRNAVNDSNSKEHLLYQNATNEIIEIHGTDFNYLPKTLIKRDEILGEDTLKQFNASHGITMLIENFSEYGGAGDMFSKFGLTMDDRLTLIVEQTNFNDRIGSKPQIGDLIYHPTSNRLFSVNYVNFDDSFNQFVGVNMSYRIECILAKYSHEELNTGITEVDNIADETDSNTQEEITQLNNAANEIIDFDSDFFGNT